jgi:GTP-binding protein HflX
LPRDQEIIISDTVGFIRDLPPDLLTAFRATLEEISDSKLIIHLVDASNPRFAQQVESVERILRELHLSEIPTILALNKVDRVDPISAQAIMRQVSAGTRESVAISALDARTLEPLLEKAGAVLARNLTRRHAREDDHEADRLSLTA